MKTPEIESLLRFAGNAIQTLHIDALGCDWDGGDAQDAMEACGLLAPHNVAGPCHPEGCVCSEFGFPTTCYRPTELGQRCLDAAAQPRGGR